MDMFWDWRYKKLELWIFYGIQMELCFPGPQRRLKVPLYIEWSSSDCPAVAGGTGRSGDQTMVSRRSVMGLHHQARSPGRPPRRLRERGMLRIIRNGMW